MQEQNKFFDKILAQVPSYLFDDITLMKMQEDPKKPEKPPGKILLKPDNMIMFRGKLTCAPNTLNNEVHTYYFADFWQKSNYELKFQGQCQKLPKYLQQNFQPQAFKYKKGSQNKAYCSEDFNYDEWMNLINKVALFNRFYTDCYNQRLKNDYGGDTPRVIYTNLRCFRLFHDWDVMGDSTSFPEFVATSFINIKESVKLETQQQSKKLNLTENGPCLTKRLKDWTNPVHLTSTMGKHKAILAHQDTDTQGMGKFFGLIFVMDEKLKLPIQPFIHRPQDYRTVDSIGWTPSQAATSFAGGNTSKLFPNSKVQKESNLNLIYNSSEDKPISNKDNPNTSTDEQNPTLMKMMQYRFNHQTKVSSVIGYLMKMKIDKQYVYDYKKLLNCPNQIWRIVPLKTDIYSNQNPTKSLNIKSSAQIFLNQVYFEKENVNGVVVDISSAIFDANTTQYQAVYPKTLELIITCGGVTFQHTFKQKKEVQKLFHQESGVLFIQDFKLPNSPIQITINEVIHSDLQNNDIIVKFTGTQTEYNFEYVDKIVKTKIKLPQDQSKIQAKGNFANFQNSVIIELFVTSYGKVVTYQQMKEKNIKFRLSSYSQVDTSGLNQYNTNQVYLKKIRAVPASSQPKDNPEPKGFEKCLTPRQRIQFMLEKSLAFKAKYQSYDNINDTIYAGKLGTIIDETNNYLKNFSWINKDGKLRYKFKDQEGSEVAMVFDQSKPTKDTIDTPAITNGMITLTIYLNKDLTSLNNPRAPAIKSVCLIGTIEIIRQNKDKQNKIVIQKITTNQFTGIFYQKELTNPYTNIDWVNKVGSTLRVMGLVYPAMQKIVNLYDFQKISMPSMKRAFEIEDQNHPRYMPATRQMSPIEHRTIRRWLYAPIYDNRMSPPRIPFAKTYQAAKLYLVETLLPAVFKLELTTIPLYLNALYSLKKEGQAAKLIRSVAKDEMKHLFIVSNLINAIGGAINKGNQRVGDKCPYPVYGQSKPIDQAIPIFPTKPNPNKPDLDLVFQFTDAENDPKNPNVPEDIRYIHQFLSSFDIQSCIQQQLLTFILLETPSEIYEVTIENCQIEVEQEIKEGEQVTINKILILLQKEEQKTNLTFIQKDQHGQMKKVFAQKNLLENNEIDENSREQLLFQKYNTLINRILNLQKGFSGLSKKILMKQQEKGMQSKTYKKFLTIGMAYDLIQQTLWFLNDNQEHETNQKTFQGNPLKQFTYLYLENMTEIINHRTALEQIRLIIEEGEGSDLFSVNGTVNKASHFFKFIQIYTGSDADIKSLFVKQLDGTLKRKALYKFKRNTVRFPDDEFQSYTNYKWNQSDQVQVKVRVENEMQVERLTNNLQYTKFPNIYAPISFLNGYHKILQELGSVFNCEPKDWMTSTNIDDFVSQQRAFEEARLTHMENAIAKMRQMTLHATHIVKPNDTYFRQNDLQVSRSTNPSYNLNQPYHYNLKDPKPKSKPKK